MTGWLIMILYILLWVMIVSWSCVLVAETFANYIITGNNYIITVNNYDALQALHLWWSSSIGFSATTSNQICRDFFFTTSETEQDYYHQKLKAIMTIRVAKWRKMQELRWQVQKYREILKLIIGNGLMSSINSP